MTADIMNSSHARWREQPSMLNGFLLIDHYLKLRAVLSRTETVL